MRSPLCNARPVLLALFLGLLTAPARAQHGGGHGGGPMPGMRMGSGGGFPGYTRSFDRSRGGPPPNNAPESAGTVSAMRRGLQVGPPGRWWDDKHFAKDLQLRPDQQRRMDSIFESNRPALLKGLTDVQQEEGRMESMTHNKAIDEAALNAQIDRVWQARAELEKAKTHYLLQIRAEMDTDQLGRLEEHH